MEVSSIILAGGKSRRLGRDKAIEPVGGEPLIARASHACRRFSEQTVVVVNSQQRASELPLPESAKIAVDLYPQGGALGGIFTGLDAADGRWGIVVACDMPFLTVELFSLLLSLRGRVRRRGTCSGGPARADPRGVFEEVSALHGAKAEGRRAEDSGLLR